MADTEKKTREDVEAQITAMESKSPYASTIAGKLEEIQDSATLLSIEGSYLGFGNDMKLRTAAEEFAAIINYAQQTKTVGVGETVSFDKGYYEAISVTGVEGTIANYCLEENRVVTPTEQQQTINPGVEPSTGLHPGQPYYGLKNVTVNAIPSRYKDVSGTTATAQNVLAGKYFGNTSSGKIEGTMSNNGAGSFTATTDLYNKVISEGYYNGKGTFDVRCVDTITVTPTESQQDNVTASDSAFIKSVTVAAIDKTTYLTKWTSTATASKESILSGDTAYVNGSLITGTMANNNAIDATLTSQGESYTVPAGYHNGKGTVKVNIPSAGVTASSPTITPTMSGPTLNDDGTKYSVTAYAKANTPVATVTAGYINAQSIVEYITVTGSLSLDVSSIDRDATAPSGIVPSTLTYDSTIKISKGYYSDDRYFSVPKDNYSTGYSDGVVATKVGTATAASVLSPFTFTSSSGVGIKGTMANNATWDNTAKSLTVDNTSITVPQGYHNGKGTVSINVQSKSATTPEPGVGIQTITPDTGYVLKSVIVPAVPDKYKNVENVTADAAHVCKGYTFVDSNGTEIQGSLTEGYDQSEQAWDIIKDSGSNGATILTLGNAHYTSVNVSLDTTLYNTLASI